MASVLSPFTIERAQRSHGSGRALDAVRATAQRPRRLRRTRGGHHARFGADDHRRAVGAVQAADQDLRRPGAVLFRVVSEDPPASAESQDLVEPLMESDAPAGYEVHVAGESAFNHDFFKEAERLVPLGHRLDSGHQPGGVRAAAAQRGPARAGGGGEPAHHRHELRLAGHPLPGRHLREDAALHLDRAPSTPSTRW